MSLRKLLIELWAFLTANDQLVDKGNPFVINFYCEKKST